ncbi:MAG: hypothetical protein ACTHWM_11800 [Yaniella sp.]|uniref:hypothetical protein n=1 Tax=Yaniella sp. TaxID=2773929 RepID=UPI003F983F10
MTTTTDSPTYRTAPSSPDDPGTAATPPTRSVLLPEGDRVKAELDTTIDETVKTPGVRTH